MDMLNSHCGVDRDLSGVVRLTICNAGSLNILGSAVIDAVREGLQQLATDGTIRVLVLAGQSEQSLIGGADIKEMARLDQASAEAFITRLRDPARPCAPFRRRSSRACPGGAWAAGSRSPRLAIFASRHTMPGSACPRCGSASPRSFTQRCCRA